MDKEELDKQILETAANWQAPFSQGSETMARQKLMTMAAKDSATPSAGNIWMRVAAAITILAIIPVVLLFLGNVKIKNEGAEILSHTLPCQSKIELITGSEIQYNKYFWRLKRKVQFSGQAFFSVKPGKLFIVDGESADVMVKGTEFTVWSDFNDLFAHCSSGEVSVSSDRDEKSLHAGEFTNVSGSRLDPVLSWNRKGFIKPNTSRNLLEFDNTPIGVVVSELEIALGLEIEHSLDPTLRYSGQLNPKDSDHCLEVFCKPFNANFVKEEDFVSIHP